MEMSRRNKQRLVFRALLLLITGVLLIFRKKKPDIIISGLIASGLATKDYRVMPFILAHIGIYSWAILIYYFVKKGE